MLQPYELLGVTHRSSPAEVRAAYFRWALLCHPDKGGSADEMATLKAAYDWVMAQVTLAGEKGGVSYEQAEEEFRAFLESQKGGIGVPSMQEVVLEKHGVGGAVLREWFDAHVSANVATLEDAFSWFRQFVGLALEVEAYREASEAGGEARGGDVEAVLEAALQDLVKRWGGVMPSAVRGGYGDLMERGGRSERDDEGWTGEEILDNAREKSGGSFVATFPTREVVVFKEQDAYTMFAPPVVAAAAAPVPLPDALDSYTTGAGCDYLEAHAPRDPSLDETLAAECPSGAVDELLAAMEMERMLQDTTLEATLTQWRTELGLWWGIDKR